VLDLIASDDWPVVLLNVVLLTLWSALPILLLAYIHQSLVMQGIRPEFSLRKSEAAELDRALVLYQGVCGRLAEIEAQSRTTKGILQLVFALQVDVGRFDDEEREDLNAHARHLRATIAKLRGLPLRRLRARVAALSFHSAVGGSLVVHAATFVILVLTLYFADLRAAARDLAGTGRNALVWYPLDASYFLANGAGAALGMLFAPAFYLWRRIDLAREHAMEFAVLKDLAGTPAEEIADAPAGRIDDEEDSYRIEPETEESCFAVLGVTQSATLEQVRAAYRMRIKQSHPDRLHDMSPTIRTFAEDETKRLNEAFQQALERLT
jgi:DnaJ-like protein